MARPIAIGRGTRHAQIKQPRTALFNPSTIINPPASTPALAEGWRNRKGVSHE
jgi:hypothetical protein